MNGKKLGGKLVGVGILLFALIAGATLYYLQVYAYYDEVETGETTIQLTSIVSGEPEEIIADGFEGIDSESSPIRFRGCFTTPMSHSLLTETYVSYDKAVPLIGPKWFSCFDAKVIGADLEEGVALPFLSQADITNGVDRVVAIYPDGRAYVWHQLNDKFAE
jgi:hypothetical protein